MTAGLSKIPAECRCCSQFASSKLRNHRNSTAFQLTSEGRQAVIIGSSQFAVSLCDLIDSLVKTRVRTFLLTWGESFSAEHRRRRYCAQQR